MSFQTNVISLWFFEELDHFFHSAIEWQCLQKFRPNLWASDHKKENCNEKKSHHENHTRFQEGNSKNALLEEHRKLRRLKNQIPEEKHPIVLPWQ